MRDATILQRFGVPPAQAERYISRMDDTEGAIATPPVQRGRLHVEGVISSEAKSLRKWGWPAISAELLREQMVGQSGDLEVWINSPGGEVTEASALAAELRGYRGGHLHSFISGVCLSAATFVALATESSEIMETGEFMIHLPRALSLGTSEELRKRADMLDVTARSVADLYAKRTGKTSDEMLSLMQNETYLTGNEAKEMGFVQEVRMLMPSRKEDKSEMAGDPLETVLQQFNLLGM